MDFKRIQIIFIAAFFFLDVFLLVSYINRTDTNYAATTSQSVNLVNEMVSQNINLPEFSEETYSVAYVQADVHNLLEENTDSLSQQTGVIDEDGLLYVSILSNPIQLSSEETLLEEDLEKLDAFIDSKAILFGKEYDLFLYQPDNGQIIYTQEANGLPIADGTSTIILYLDSANQVISYEQRYAGPVTEQGSKMDLITDREAVETVFQNNEIASNTTVKRPVLTYYRTLKLEDLSMYAPVWYIRVEGQSGVEIHRVDAINGSIITGVPVEPPTSPPSIDTPEEPNNDTDEALNQEIDEIDEDISDDFTDDISWSSPPEE